MIDSGFPFVTNIQNSRALAFCNKNKQRERKKKHDSLVRSFCRRIDNDAQNRKEASIHCFSLPWKCIAFCICFCYYCWCCCCSSSTLNSQTNASTLQGRNILMKANKRLSCWLDLCKWCQRNFSLLRNALFPRLTMHIHGNSHQSNWYTQTSKCKIRASFV